MKYHDNSKNRSEYQISDNIRNLTTFQPRVSGADLSSRALEWFNDTESPRFLWTHFMDPHAPYLPGFTRARNIGVFRSYPALISNSRNTYQDDTATKILSELYWGCIKALDNRLDSYLNSLPEDAHIILLGDHGEELGPFFGHSRLKKR